MSRSIPSFPDASRLAARLERVELPVRRGRITAVGEPVLLAELAGARVGQQCEIRSAGRGALLAEVAACDGLLARLLPLGEHRGLGPGDSVEVVAPRAFIGCGPGLLGRAIDPLGAALDGAGRVLGLEPVALEDDDASALGRGHIRAQLETGVAAIDACCALGEGQRIGLFAGPGLGKSTLLEGLAQAAQVDLCVTCLVGERAREAREAAARLLEGPLRQRHVLVVATAEAPALVRLRALSAATSIARWFVGQGRRVLLLVDSLTRVARAAREAFASLGQVSGAGGYPAAALAVIPRLVERAATGGPGSLTAVYAVLTEEGLLDPVAEEAKAVLDGHLVLSARLARAGLFPAVDIVESVSRVFGQVCPRSQVEAARRLKAAQHRLRQNEDLVLMGAYQKGSCRYTDFALERRADIEALLYPTDASPPTGDELRRRLEALTSGI